MPTPGVTTRSEGEGSNRRLVSDKQFRALMIRDGGCCTVPGCASTIGLEAHHVHFWMYGGKTIMANLVLLCRAHHHAVHDGDLRITAHGNEQFSFHRRDRNELMRHSDPARLIANRTPIENDHDQVSATATTTRWDGTHLDLDYAVATFAQDLTSTPRRSA